MSVINYLSFSFIIFLKCLLNLPSCSMLVLHLTNWLISFKKASITSSSLLPGWLIELLLWLQSHLLFLHNFQLWLHLLTLLTVPTVISFTPLFPCGLPWAAFSSLSSGTYSVTQLYMTLALPNTQLLIHGISIGVGITKYMISVSLVCSRDMAC